MSRLNPHDFNGTLFELHAEVHQAWKTEWKLDSESAKQRALSLAQDMVGAAIETLLLVQQLEEAK